LKETAEFLLALYRAARERGPDEFRHSALAQLQLTVPSFSGVWGDARRIGSGYAAVPTTLHVENLDDRFLVDWAQVQHEDPAVPILLANTGRAIRVHVPSFYSGTPEMLAMAKGRDIRSMSCISVQGLKPNQIHWISLFSHKDDVCSDPQRNWLEACMPHLTEAWRINEALHAHSQHGTSDRLDIAVAEAATGLMLRSDTGLLSMLAREWSGFDGVHVPAPVVDLWKRQQIFVHLGRHSRIDGRRFGELVYLAARRKNDAESLTPRRLEIAQMYAQGMSNKEIAQSIALSPSTVRNHLAQIYESLQVHDRQEMIKRLNELLR
jgi:DNA-binding CsgD family transcriptional regulator